MHVISSYGGNRPTNTLTNKLTNRQDRLQYTAPQLARSVINQISTALYGRNFADSGHNWVHVCERLAQVTRHAEVELATC